MSNFIFENYLTDASGCDDLIEWHQDNKEHHKSGHAYFHGEGIVDKTHKDSTDFSFSMTDVMDNNKYGGEKILGPFLQDLQIMLERYVACFPFSKNCDRFTITESMLIQHYLPYQGFKTFHCERFGLETMRRHLVFIAYLNTVEDGGGTEFLNQNYMCEAKKGKVVIFPTDWTYPHRGIVSPTQEKYILTGWWSYIKELNV